MASPLLDVIAKEHPAFVHVPLGLVAIIPLLLLFTYRSATPIVWVRASIFLAIVALAGSLAAMLSGLLWGRLIALIAPGAYFPQAASEGQALQRLLQRHEFAAVTGIVLGALCLGLLLRSLRRYQDRLDQPPHRRLSDRGVGIAALAASLLWLGAFATCGKLGGLMVFGSEETNRAAAEADAKRKNDAEAELPLRALDYASLEPLQAAPFRSKAHGDRWARIWVPTAAAEAYQAGKALAPGAYVVLTTYEDQKGKASFDPGPLYFKEVLADGRAAFAFYWPRVPEARRLETGGEDSVYWRSPDPKLNACAVCHTTAGPAIAPLK